MAVKFLSSIDISGTASISNISNDDSSYTGILVWDGSLLKYRTKAQLLSDIGSNVNNYVSSVSFNIDNGILSLARTGLATLTVDLDGRYALASGNVDGSGTTNFVAKWLDSNTIQDSVIYDNGTNVGIGTASPGAKLHVEGGSVLITKAGNARLNIERENGAKVEIKSTPSLGYIGTMNDMPFQIRQNGSVVASFDEDGTNGKVIIPNGNVGIGTTTPSAKLDVNGDALINGLTVGKGSGNLSQNVALGIQALDSNTTGNNNTSIGEQALKNNTTGNNNVGVGKDALLQSQSSFNTAIGALALIYMQTGEDNTAIGWGAGGPRVGGTNGSSSGCVFIGKLTTSNGIGAVNEIVIGTNAISAGSNTVVLGNDNIISTRLKGDVIVANGNVGIGTTTPGKRLQVGNGTLDDTIRVVHNDGEYTDIHGYGLEMSRTASYIRPVTDGTGNLNIGENIKTWNSVIQNADTHIFKKDNSEWMRITSDGLVGIGTIAPISNGGAAAGLLHINGGNTWAATHYTNTSTGAGTSDGGVIAQVATDLEISNYEAGEVRLSTNNTRAITIDSSQNVGIGTTSPSAQLHSNISGGSINYGMFTLDTNAWLNFFTGTGTAPGASAAGQGALFWKSNTVFRLGTSTSIAGAGFVDMVRIDENGNVGIGTTSPGSKLEVAGGDIEVDDSSSGLILKSPDGTRYRITAANGGTLTVTAV